MMKSTRSLSTFFLAATLLCGSSISHAQDLNTDPHTALDNTRLVEASISKLYRARVLLEDYRRWPESFELLRDILKNDQTLTAVPRKKIETAAAQIKMYLPGRWLSRAVGGRHLLRPFLEASYLLNEALMDSRVALNTSSDSEVIFVEQLLKSYFFPGNETQGEIEFPAYESYSFDLYALNAENIAAARRERSDDPEAKQAETTKLAEPVQEKAIAPDAAPVDLDDASLSRRFTAANGFINNLIDGGVAIAEITKEARSLISHYQVPNRVKNRYLPTSMLLQAIADPGTALLDPQLQSFLKGVRLKVALGQTESPGVNDILSLKQILGANAVFERNGETRIRLSYLMDQQTGNSYMKSGLELSLQDVKGSGRSILYAISTVSGEEQMMLRTLQAAAAMARDMDHAVAIGKQVATALPLIGKLQKLGSISLTSLLAALPAAAQGVNALVATANGGLIGTGLRTAAWALKGIVSLQSVGVKVTTKLSPKAMKILSAAKNNKYVKDGSVTGILTLAVAATQITVGVIEYRATDDEDRKSEIYVDTLARVGATASYMLPVVGWAAAALDLGHAFLGVPVETADLFKGYGRAVSATTYWFMGTSEADVKMTEIEAALNIPRNDIFFTQWGKQKNLSVEACNMSLTKLRSETQSLAIGELSFIYLAHRSFASGTNYSYGARLETHLRSYLNNKKAANDAAQKIQEDLKSQLSLKVSGGPEGGAEGSARSGAAA
ncbi:MAG: hypothetical protein ABIR96_11425 [Bdellovibrionota bacterium]